MNKEKATMIQRYYDYVRLVLVILLIGLLLYLSA